MASPYTPKQVLEQKALIKDYRAKEFTYRQMSRLIGISIPTVHTRIKKMINSGEIKSTKIDQRRFEMLEKALKSIEIVKYPVAYMDLAYAKKHYGNAHRVTKHA